MIDFSPGVKSVREQSVKIRISLEYFETDDCLIEKERQFSFSLLLSIKNPNTFGLDYGPIKASKISKRIEKK